MTDLTKPHDFEYSDYEVQDMVRKDFCVCGLPDDSPLHIKPSDLFEGENSSLAKTYREATEKQGWKERFYKKITHGKYDGDVGSNVIKVDAADQIIEFIQSERLALLEEIKQLTLKTNSIEDDDNGEYYMGYHQAKNDLLTALDRLKGQE